MLDFRSDNITQLSRSENKGISVLKWIGGLIAAAALIFDVRTVFSNLQNAETGEFDATGFASVNWILIAVVSVIAIIAAIVLFYLSSKKTEKE